VHTLGAGSTNLIGSLWRRAVAVPIGILAAGALVMAGGVASGAPQPSVTQIQQKLNKLNTQADKLDDQFNQVQQELTSANQRLALVNKQAARYLVTFNSMRTQVAQIAAQQFENSALTTPEALLTSGDPQEILNQSSILLELSSSNRSAMRQYFAAAKRLEGAQESARRAKDAIAGLKTKLASKRTTLKKAIAQQQSLLAQITPAQNTGLGAGGTTVAQFSGSTSTQGGKAAAFAVSKLGCPYVFGGTGPCGSGYDCSGLTMTAWAAAGVSIQRTSEEQWASLPHVSTSALEPGDILVFAGASHVGIYVGNNMLVDAPHTGLNVEEVALTGWYLSNLDGAVRP
jgi:peptidoglycan DL-endopeptidase CwlO